MSHRDRQAHVGETQDSRFARWLIALTSSSVPYCLFSVPTETARYVHCMHCTHYSLILIPCTVTFTCTTEMPSDDSSANFTLLMILRATSEMRVPYSRITYRLTITCSLEKVTSTPLEISSRRNSSAHPGRECREASPTTP